MEPERIRVHQRIALHIRVRVDAPRQPDGIGLGEPLHHRVVVPRPVEVQPRPIVLPRRVPQTVSRLFARHRRLSIRISKALSKACRQACRDPGDPDAADAADAAA